MKKTNLFLLISFLCLNVSAQVAMGKWRTHFAYNAIKQITQSDNKVYALSEGSMFSIDKEDESMEFYSKMNGLNDANIVWIDYDKFSKKVIIVYQNGNIDLLGSGGIINIPDYYNKQLSISKAVNHICFAADKAYLSCNFGILVLNTKRNEIADSYFIGPNGSDIKVLATEILDNKLYALTQNTIYKANANEPNLVNFEYWSTMQNLPGSGELKKLNLFGNKLILQRDNKLYTYTENEGWQNMLGAINVTDVNISNDKMIIYTSAQEMYFVNENLDTKLIENTGEVFDADYDAVSNTYWLAANAKGVLAVSGQSDIQTKTYKPVGPAVNSPWSMTFAGEKLFVVSGRPKSGEWKDGNIMIYEKNKWENIIGQNDIKPIIKNDVYNLMTTAVDPTDNNHFFVTSFGNGLLEFKNNTFLNWHNSSNSNLSVHNAISNPAIYNYYTRLDGATFDTLGNLFITNSTASDGKKIKIRLKNGDWNHINFPGMTNYDLGQILIDKQNPNNKWIMTSGYGIINVIDDKGTLNDSSDDTCIAFDSFNDPDNEGGKITHNKEYCIVQDLNGVIWLGTDQGPLLFYNTSKVFDAGYTCSRIKIPRNDGTGLADYLLQSDKVKAIAIDGANRKWIGTETSGVYLMSENGQETIKHFTTSNSPLISNDILSIAINPVSGEVFFGTSYGLVSYQSDAADASDTFGNVRVYPNPVRENYNGVITITGLVKDTQVKITDLNGNLICQTTSNGSLATWDGKNSSGNKVSTGIYLVLCANEDGTQSSVTKIMIIN